MMRNITRAWRAGRGSLVALALLTFAGPGRADSLFPLNFSASGGVSSIGPTTATTCGDTRVLFADAGLINCLSTFTFTKATGLVTTTAVALSSGIGLGGGAVVTNRLTFGAAGGTIAFTGEGYLQTQSNGVFGWLKSDGSTIAQTAIDGSDILSMRRGANTQEFNIYNTYTDASNYEAGSFSFKRLAGNLSIGTYKAGTGATRDLSLVSTGVIELLATTVTYFKNYGAYRFYMNDTSFVPYVDNAYNLGTAGSRFANIYAVTIAQVGGAYPTIVTLAAITTGAGASVGTLTNAPAAGNPTKWLPINDAGTTRYIPAW